jgi:acyl carrier protein
VSEFIFLCTELFNQLNYNIMSDIASRVKAIIVEKLGVDESEVTPEASFTNDLGADSLDTVELIMEFEKEFNVAIPDDQAETIGTVGQAVAYLEKNVK